MSESNSGSGGGVSVASLLGVVFVTLKLIGIQPVADWSWWWVTAPFWGGFALLLAVLAVAALGASTLAGVAAIFDRRRRNRRIVR
jgi:small Trp-rich protein